MQTFTFDFYRSLSLLAVFEELIAQAKRRAQTRGSEPYKPGRSLITRLRESYSMQEIARNVIRHERAGVSERQHIGELKNRPFPSTCFAFDDSDS